jgi:predicted RNA-binding Zn ribbon-like protein
MTSELDTLLAFLESAVEEGDPVGRSPAGLAGWLTGHGLVPPGASASDDDVIRARRLRAALLAILRAEPGQELDPRTAAAIAAVTERAPFRFVLGDDGSLRPSGAGSPIDRALAELVAMLYRTQLTGERPRLKACKQCGFAFYDESKNRSRIWCDMALCGSQEKSRAYRQRKKAALAEAR